MSTIAAFACFVTLLPAFVTAQASAVRLVGRVVAIGSNEAIAGAVVRVGGIPYTTDPRGRFVIPLSAPGPIEMTVEMIGYATRTDTLKPAPGTNDVLVQLSRTPVRLPPLSVSVRSLWLEENGFYERRMEGGSSGHYIDRAELEKRNPTFMTDLFFGVSGARVHNLGMLLVLCRPRSASAARATRA
ncbi:MAG: carboxypeptidase regulatory-like domain-containing protein [Longimicrobiales bacterium]